MQQLMLPSPLSHYLEVFFTNGYVQVILKLQF